MFVKLNNKLYEVDNDKVEDFLTEQVILKVDDVFKEMGAMSSTIKSMLNSFLLMKGFKKEENSTLIESALIEIISTLLEENKEKVFELELKEVSENE